MSLKSAHLQAQFAKRREAEHNRIERTEAVNKYYDHWGKVTARFDNWTRPDYYKQADQQLENTKQQKEKQKKLVERQEKLAKLFEMERNNLEQEMQEKEKSKNSRRNVDTRTLEKIEENLREQQLLRRRLELEAKLYGKWRHGVDDDNLLYESKNDNEVLAKLNWLDKQVDQQLQRDKDEKAAKEHELKLQQEMNKSEELQKERQRIRENEIHEIRCMQGYHLEQLKERQKEADELKEKEKQLRGNLSELNKELELLEESYDVLSQPADFGDAYNLNKIKIFIRKRSQVFRNQINICLSILERIMNFSEKPEVLNHFKKRLEQQLKTEGGKLAQIECMYESEAKHNLQRSEEIWQLEHEERYKELKRILMEEMHLINTSIEEAMKREEALLEMRTTHLGVIDNSSEKLKLLIQDIQYLDEAKRVHLSPRRQTTNNIIHSQLEESADTPLFTPRRCAPDTTEHLQPEEPHHDVEFGSRRNCYDSVDNNLSPRCITMDRMSNSFSNLNLDVCQANQGHSSQREMESDKLNSQRSLQVVTAQTEADRPRFGRKHMAWN